ncbi:MAG: anhydro-N-acetylmuramic acid kinase [Beijerinckiaceae bacterium]
MPDGRGHFRAIGFMSGTSMDGVDVALIETDGEFTVTRGPFFSLEYSFADRSLLRQALEDARAMTDRAHRPDSVAEAELMVDARHAEALGKFLARHSIARESIDVIGFHGQTVLHRPEMRLTVQIGNGAALAKAVHTPVVYDMRAADVAAGGQGAPLAPAYHRALVGSADVFGPVAVVNIGGVANVTLVGGRNDDPVAFDTGPGNALVDDLMAERTGAAFDADGAAAAGGTIDERILGELLDHAYFRQPWPKSLDRNDFSGSPVAGLATEDAAATLTAFTARSIALALGHMEEKPRLAVICGGGAKNKTLMSELRRMPCEVKTADQMGWSSEAMEAEAFAYLAVRSLKGLPLSWPTTTGVPRAMTGGVKADP